MKGKEATTNQIYIYIYQELDRYMELLTHRVPLQASKNWWGGTIPCFLLFWQLPWSISFIKMQKSHGESPFFSLFLFFFPPLPSFLLLSCKMKILYTLPKLCKKKRKKKILAAQFHCCGYFLLSQEEVLLAAMPLRKRHSTRLSHLPHISCEPL